MQSGFNIRPATVDDIPRLAELDLQRFGPEGMGVYDERYFRVWLEVHPEGLIVALNEQDVIVGYRYTQLVDFDPRDIPTLTTNDDFTDRGFTRKTHKPGGNSMNGVSVCSRQPGARYELFVYALEQLKMQRRLYEFGFSRIPGFSAYRAELDASGIDTSGMNAKDLATWYALECARLGQALVWDWLKPVDFGGRLPPPRKPDRVLNKYLEHEGFGVAAILPSWIQDPPSEDFGVMVLFQNPNVTPPAA